MTILSGGNVGIGTNAPASVLHVQGVQPPPAPAFTVGTPATEVLRVVGGKGGLAGFNSGGGLGAGVLIQAGDGGDCRVQRFCMRRSLGM